MAENVAPGSPYETYVRWVVYHAFPFRRRRWLSWRDVHRLRYEAMEQEIAGRFALDDEGRALLATIVRRWM